MSSLSYYTKKFAEYSDDGRTLNGAYGYRWRHALPRVGHVYDQMEGGDGPPREVDHSVDQLDLLVAHLRASPDSRRAVLTMWDVQNDLLKVGAGVSRCRCGFDGTHPGEECSLCTGKPLGSLDTCCNLSVIFSLRTCGRGGCLGGGYVPTDRDDSTCDVCGGSGRLLDMTVTNRSNDLIWGTLGANYVTFSVLLEYMASRLGAGVGRYHQFTNNLHVYDWNWEPEKWLAWREPGFEKWTGDWYQNHPAFRHSPLVSDPAAFEVELLGLVDYHGRLRDPREDTPTYTEPFLRDVAQPMFFAFHCHKAKDPAAALAWAGRIAADDWRIACTAWLRRRAGKGVTT